MSMKKEQATYSHKDLCNIVGLPEDTETQVLVSHYLFGENIEPQVKFVWPGGTKNGQ